MTSIVSTTTWTLDQQIAEREGSALFFVDDTLYIATHPDEKIETTNWDDLKNLTDAFRIGFFTYEKKAHFYRPTKLQKIKRPQPPPLEPALCNLINRSDTKATTFAKIAQIKELIEAGEIYQVNLTQEFTFETNHTSFELFKRVYARSPARFAAYINCGDHAILSFSPELFLQKRANQLTSSPIKGTAPRGTTPQEDAQNRATLLSSDKERAELLMITDLMRNDLGRVCTSVNVTQLYACTAYPTIYHLHSTVVGKCKPLHPIDLIAPLFPAGSISGCPKGRALKAISQLEQRERGVYTGAIGCFEPNGDFTFNVAIRTLTYKDGIVSGQFGGGIVYDSDPQKEYEEALHKASSLFDHIE